MYASFLVGTTTPCAIAAGINLTWIDRSRIEEVYHIDREIAGGSGFETLIDLDANTESHSYEDPTQEGELRFRVYASNQYGFSGFSNIATTLPDQATDEDTPMELWVFTDELAGLEGPMTAVLKKDSESLIFSVLVVPSDDFRSCQILLTPMEHLFGHTSIEIDLIRNEVSLTKAFDLEVRSVNDPPIIGTITPQETAEGAPLEIVLPIGDVDTDLSDLTVVAMAGDSSLIESSIAEYIQGRGWVLSAVPSQDQYGETEVTFEVEDGEFKIVSSLVLTVTNVNDSPTIGPIAPQETIEGTPLEVVLPIGDLDTDLSDLTVVAAAGDLNLIESSIAEYIQERGWVLIVVPRVNRYGETEVTVEVDDGELTDNTSFDLSVWSAPVILTKVQPQMAVQGGVVHDIVIEVHDQDSEFENLELVPTLDVANILRGYSVTPVPESKQMRLSLSLDPDWSGEATLRLELTDERGVSSNLDLILTVRPGPWVYVGFMGNDGRFAFYVSHDGMGTLLAWDADNGKVVFFDGISVGGNGDLRLVDDETSEPVLEGSLTAVQVSIRIIGTGQNLFGDVVPLGDTSSAFMGVHEGFVPGLPGGVVRAIVGPDGKSLVALDSASLSVGLEVVVDSEGFAKGDWLNVIDFDLRLDRLTGRITGGAEFAGLHWPVAANKDPNAQVSQMANLSTRAWAGTGAQSIIAGFVVEGSEPKGLLLRGIGPGLIEYGVAGVLNDPRLLLNDGQGVVASNEDWGLDADPDRLAEVARQLGGFALIPGSLDSALYVDLGSGRFTAIVRAEEGTNGLALVELYDATLGGESRLINLSTRLVVRERGEGILGFVITGSTRVQVLIRAVGPALESFGLKDVLPDPVLKVYGYSDTLAPFLENDNWSDLDGDLVHATSIKVGAFPLESESSDAAIVVWLDPGVYSAKAVDANGASGVVLTELYVVP